jgi:hypothetical protein
MATSYDQKTVKPANDAYTGMLAISLLALLVGCGVLYLDYTQYGGEMPKKLDYNVRERAAREQVEKARTEPKVPDDNPEEKKDAPDGKGGR